MAKQAQCDLCNQPGGELIYQHDQYRVVLVDDPHYPGFCRVIWNEHVAEMTDLAPAERATLMDAVWRVEQAVREVMRPHKINIASFGNMVPHLHWHVIPRYQNDMHFPNPIWGEVKRNPEPAELAPRKASLSDLSQNIMSRLASA